MDGSGIQSASQGLGACGCGARHRHCFSEAKPTPQRTLASWEGFCAAASAPTRSLRVSVASSAVSTASCSGPLCAATRGSVAEVAFVPLSGSPGVPRAVLLAVLPSSGAATTTATNSSASSAGVRKACGAMLHGTKGSSAAWEGGGKGVKPKGAPRPRGLRAPRGRPAAVGCAGGDAGLKSCTTALADANVWFLVLGRISGNALFTEQQGIAPRASKHLAHVTG